MTIPARRDSRSKEGKIKNQGEQREKTIAKRGDKK